MNNIEDCRTTGAPTFPYPLEDDQERVFNVTFPLALSPIHDKSGRICEGESQVRFNNYKSRVANDPEGSG